MEVIFKIGFNILNLDQYTGIIGFGTKTIQQGRFFRFSLWINVGRYINHLTIYHLVNKMKIMGEINILLVFLFFFCRFRPIIPNFLILEHIYINIIEFSISNSTLNLIDRRFDALLLPLPHCSLSLDRSSDRNE